jgi:hypothetical protein
LDQELISLQKNSALLSGTQPPCKRTLFLGAGTHLNEEEPCSLEQKLNHHAAARCSLDQELISTQKVSALLSRNSTTRQKNVVPWNLGTHLNADELSLWSRNSTTMQKSPAYWTRNSSHRRKTTLFFG